MNKEIKIIDMPMGEGKTNGIIRYMNNNPQNKYLFITPFLDEIKRIKDSCPELRFKEPDDKYSKLSSLKSLIADGCNIASTHSLFSIVDSKVRELLLQSGYILILDEVLEIVDPLEIAPRDLQLLINDKVVAINNDDGKVTVADPSYKGKGCRFSKEISAIKNQDVYFVDESLLLCLFNYEVFNCFDDVIILTYMFDGSIMSSYFKLYHLDYKYCYIVDDYIVDGKFDDTEFKKHIKDLINIYDGNLNKIGEKKTSLCSNWYKTKRNKGEHIILKNNIYNYFKNIIKSNAKEAMWSTLTGYNGNIKEFFSPKSFTKNCFVPCNIRATNNFMHKKNLVYAVNVFLNPFILKYFSRNGIKLNEENYALSQLLQWIWRSCIRCGEKINIYIPSKRMRNLFVDYLNS